MTFLTLILLFLGHAYAPSTELPILLIIIAPLVAFAQLGLIMLISKNQTPRILPHVFNRISVWQPIVMVAIGFVQLVVVTPYWSLGFAFALDWLVLNIWRIYTLTNPLKLIKEIAQKGVARAKKQQHEAVLERIETLLQIAMHHQWNDDITLVQKTLEATDDVILAYGANITNQESASYVLWRHLTFIQHIFESALEEGCAPIIDQILISIGNLANAVSDKNIELIPISFSAFKGVLEHFDEAQYEGHEHVVAMLEELLKLFDKNTPMLGSVMNQYLEVLEMAVKGMFRMNKQTPTPVLFAPFEEVKSHLVAKGIQEHPEVGMINATVDRIIGEFKELEAIMGQVDVGELLKGSTE